MCVYLSVSSQAICDIQVQSPRESRAPGCAGAALFLFSSGVSGKDFPAMLSCLPALFCFVSVVSSEFFSHVRACDTAWGFASIFSRGVVDLKMCSITVENGRRRGARDLVWNEFSKFFPQRRTTKQLRKGDLPRK